MIVKQQREILMQKQIPELTSLPNGGFCRIRQELDRNI